MNQNLDWTSTVTLAFAVLVLLFGAVTLWRVAFAPRDHGLETMILESDGRKVSLSRFQLLLFTFVVAGLFLLLSVQHGQFVDIPAGVLGLLGISGGSFIISKGITQSGQRGNAPTPLPPPGP